MVPWPCHTLYCVRFCPSLDYLGAGIFICLVAGWTNAKKERNAVPSPLSHFSSPAALCQRGQIVEGELSADGNIGLIAAPAGGYRHAEAGRDIAASDRA